MMFASIVSTTIVKACTTCVPIRVKRVKDIVLFIMLIFLRILKLQLTWMDDCRFCKYNEFKYFNDMLNIFMLAFICTHLTGSCITISNRSFNKAI